MPDVAVAQREDVNPTSLLLPGQQRGKQQRSTCRNLAKNAGLAAP
jgi:hypothetical protein